MQNTHNRAEVVPELVSALIDLVGFLNRPGPDIALLKDAGIALDRVLFPLLVIIGQRGPIGVVELAGHVGRDYTTVSRQLAKLESLGLVSRQPGGTDRRVHEVTVTGQGRAATSAIDAARERMILPVFAHWSEPDIADLVRLTRRFVDDLTAVAALRRQSGGGGDAPAPE
jgi:DNA-binding MarR family transcriptional regulator